MIELSPWTPQRIPESERHREWPVLWQDWESIMLMVANECTWGNCSRTQGPFFSFAYWWQKDSGHFHPALMKDCWNGSACVPFTLPWFSFLWPFAVFNKNGLGLHNRFPHNTEIHTIHNCALNQASRVFFSSLKSFSIRAILWSVTDESWKCSSFAPVDPDRHRIQ